MTLAEMKAACERGEDETDWERLRYEAEHDIEPEPDEDSPILSAEERRIWMPCLLTTEKTSVRLDPDIIEALKADGPGWEGRMNIILRHALNLPGTPPPLPKID